VPAAAVVTLIGVALTVLTLAFYLTWIAVILKKVVNDLVPILESVVGVSEKSRPVGPVVNDINADLAHGRDALEACVHRLEARRAPANDKAPTYSPQRTMVAPEPPPARTMVAPEPPPARTMVAPEPPPARTMFEPEPPPVAPAQPAPPAALPAPPPPAAEPARPSWAEEPAPAEPATRRWWER